MIDARWRAALERSARRAFHRLPPRVRRPIRRIRARVTFGGRRGFRPVAVPGRGPVVLVDARGCDWDLVARRVAAGGDQRERLIVITDRPEMQIGRELPVIVEYLAADPARPDLATHRLDELRRVYSVDRSERLRDGTIGTVSAC